ncbi:protein of unknown function [Kyrpidia spormannii]|uniref:Uncharacterized protein n=1 Tax=Kyrpidia spormannii TaxID=2055160 RepID=A0A6F9EF59_9BACL|nr:protein of unknown function [Kyrpidia spormannii]
MQILGMDRGRRALVLFQGFDILDDLVDRWFQAVVHFDDLAVAIN